ncbi:Tim44 domain-containing protein [Burkholderia gladioli]|uniref:Tim44 domain-containing protein n=1 Tax=Burkholderia gladioli TaxID=28095 RepID=UPI0016409475|nr:TIM44-like domain-containing protein [Burkholderia gladioli]MBU9383555.1 TIM44-like domain-containing protein [Burkholderia gladioli]MDN7802227.1 TIM44-like domain-containing protein [Burkholderia gladioli]
MSDSRSFNNRSKQPRPWARRIGTLFMVGLLTAGTFASLDAEARRMGGGRSVGRQSQMVQQRQATPPAQQQPMQQAAPSPAQRGAQPAPAAQPNRSRWLGPIAGLAAGLGIAALLSHFGLGGAFASMMANVIVIALLAFIGIWIVRKLMNRNRKPEPAYAGAGSSPGSSMNRGGYDAGSNGGYASQNQAYAPASSQPQPASSSSYANEAAGVFGGAAAAGAGLAPAGTAPSVPAGFDSEAFVRNAKVYFIRLQAAWDEGNMTDIREFTTPEMFAEVKVDLASRGADKNQTDVVQLEAELLGVEERGNQYEASVRFHGLIREAPGASAEPFEEVWNLTKSGNEGWLLAGIQQINLH